MLATIGARRRTANLGTLAGLTWTGDAVTILNNTRYNAFPGMVKAPNGDLLVAYRDGTGHFYGHGLWTMRSTDGGATWGSPQLVADKTTEYGWGTATLSIVNGQVALVSWIRALSGTITPYPDGTRIFLSSDSGATWSAPHTVTTGPDWLRMHSVSESPLIYHAGWYYLAIWGVDGDEPGNTYYHSGIVRSQNLTTWERVAQFDYGGAQQFNEAGIARIGDTFVCVIRHESTTNGRFVSTSPDGVTWTDQVKVTSPGNEGAPKMATATMLAHNLVPLRDTQGGGFMAAVDESGGITDLGSLGIPYQASPVPFMYGQVARFNETHGAVVWSHQFTNSRADLFYRPFTLATTP